VQLQEVNNKLKFRGLSPAKLTFPMWLGLFQAWQEFGLPKKELIIGSEKRLEKEQAKIKRWRRTR
jgi:hypothetical protein